MNMNRSNKIPPAPALGQLEEHVGFLVSRSLTLPAAQPDEPQMLFDDCHDAQKKRKIIKIINLRGFHQRA